MHPNYKKKKKKELITLENFPRIVVENAFEEAEAWGEI